MLSPSFLDLIKGLGEALRLLPDLFDPFEMGSALLNLADLGFPGPGSGLYDGFESACLSTDFDGYSGRDMAAVISAFARIGYQPGEAFVKAFMAACVRSRFERFNGQALSKVVVSFAALGRDPGRDFLVAFEAACSSSPGLKTFRGQDLVDLVVAFDRLGWRPEQAFVSALEQACQGPDLNFRRDDLVVMVEVVSKLAPSTEFMLRFGQACLSPTGLARLEPDQVASAFSSMSRIAPDALPGFYEWFEQECASRGLGGLSLDRLSSVVSGLRLLGHGPSRLFRMRLMQTVRICVEEEIGASELLAALRLLVQIDCQPSVIFLQQLEEKCLSAAGGFEALVLVEASACLICLGHRLGEGLKEQLAGACDSIGRYDSMGAKDLLSVMSCLKVLGRKPELELLSAVERAFSTRGLEALNGWQLVELLTSMREGGLRPQQSFVQAVEQACVGRGFAGFDGQDLASLVTEVGALGPSDSFLYGFESACVSSGLLATLEPCRLSSLIYGLSQTSHAPVPGFCEQLEQACLAQLVQRSSGQQLVGLVVGLRRLRHRISPAFLLEFENAYCSISASASVSGLVAVVDSLAQMGCKPSTCLLEKLQRECFAKLAFFKTRPAAFARTLHALLQLGHRPRDDLLQHFRCTCESAPWYCLPVDGRDLSSVLRACAALELCPSNEFWLSFEKACTGGALRGSSFADLHGLLVSIKALGHRPSADFMRSFEVALLLSELKGADLLELRDVLGALKDFDYSASPQLLQAVKAVADEAAKSIAAAIADPSSSTASPTGAAAALPPSAVSPPPADAPSSSATTTAVQREVESAASAVATAGATSSSAARTPTVREGVAAEAVSRARGSSPTAPAQANATQTEVGKVRTSTAT